MAACRVGVVDDHPLYARALEHLVKAEDDLRWVGFADTVGGLLREVPQPELVLLDLRLADGSTPHDNIELLHASGVRVLVYTSGEHPELLRSAARAGVLGVVLKSEAEATVIAAIRAASRGEPVVTSEWAAAVDGDPDLARVDLSPQLQRVLTRWAEGETVASIARGLGVSIETVNDYKRRIQLKYAEAGRPTHTKQDFLKRAMEDGWVPYPIHRKPL
jgi:DNA-binding NarL/FixJ family response regulator